VVASWRKYGILLAIRHENERQLFAFERFLQHYPLAGRAKLLDEHRPCDEIPGFSFRLRQQNALARA
jgi:hypothetical protein